MVKMFKVLGNETRLSVVRTLVGARGVTVGELAVAVGVELSVLSKHLDKMEAIELVARKESGRYSLVILDESMVSDLAMGLMKLLKYDGDERNEIWGNDK